MPDFVKIPDKIALYEAADTENIKAVVGGINTDYFAPSANISFKMQSGEEKYFFNIADDIDQVKTVGQAEDFNADKLAVRGGDVESTFTLGDTSLKIERVFSTKPTEAPRYKLAFSPGVQFFYQPELTAEEIAEGCERPDNVVGSYAVYCDQQGHLKNSDGSTKVNYGCGKIGHLYAPYWTDADGNKIKGTQEIQGNILTFALPPQEWLDSAVLPITLDPDVGYTTAGATTVTYNSIYVYGLAKDSPASGGTVESMSLYTAFAGTNVFKLGIYEDSAGLPGDLLLTTDEGIEAAASWVDVDVISPADVVSGTDYWCGVMTDGVAGKYDTVADEEAMQFKSGQVYGTWPDPFPSLPGDNPRLCSVYFTYTESGGLLPIKLTGSADAVSGILGNINVRKGLSGDINATSGISGLIHIRKSLSGTLNATGFVSANLTVSGTVTLSGGLSALAGVSGSLSVRKSLSGSLGASSDISGSITIDTVGKVSLSGSIGAMSAIHGALSVRRGLSGSIDAVSDIDGNINLKVSMSGSADAVAELAGRLRVIGESSLGVVIDPSIESVTVKRILESITVKRTIISV